MYSSHSLLVMNLENPIAVFSFPLYNIFLYFWMVICSWYVNVLVSNHCGRTLGSFLFFDKVIMLDKNDHKLFDIVLRAESILLIETHKLWVFSFSIIDCISPWSCFGIYAWQVNSEVNIGASMSPLKIDLKHSFGPYRGFLKYGISAFSKSSNKSDPGLMTLFS